MAIAITRLFPSLLLLCSLFLLAAPSSGFQSHELLVDGDEFARRRSADSGSDPDSKIQFQLEHAFGDSDFSPSGTFTARLKTSPNGAQTLTKLRFSRNALRDDFYQIRLPSNLVSQPGREYIISSVKARCLSQRDALDEHFVINMDGVNVLGVNYGPPGSCQYPRVFRQVLRTPVFTEAVLGENGEGEELKPPERSFWAKYWMYLIPLGSFS
ncbi:hypothetical protein OROHE_015561 [Orobanche hederae]